MASPSRRIAVLLDHVESDYHEAVIAGAYRAARDSRVRMLVVAGGWLGAGNQRITRNFIYDFVARARVDGAIVLGGSLSNFSGVEPFRAWMRGLSHIPTLTIGLDIGAVPCVRADNEQGVRAIIDHLIEVHGRRRIACVRGPSGGPEADARFSAYRAALASHGLRFDRRLVVDARLGRDDGMTAVSVLFDERRFTPATLDALVCVNDDVARGALEGLKQRSISVPDQVAVVGFDNGAGAQSASPPLTSVDQGIEQQAHEAARRLIEAIETGQPARGVVLGTRPVLRSSCGCSAPLQNDSSEVRAPLTGTAHTCRLALLERRSLLSEALATCAGARLNHAPGWESRLVDALLQDLSAAGSSQVVHQFEALARRHVMAGGDLGVCHDALTVFRLQALRCAALEAETRPRIEDLLQEARLSVGRIGLEFERSRQEMLHLRVRIIAKECYALLAGGAVESVARVLEEHLPALGIQGYAVSRFVSPGDPNAGLEVLAQRSQGAQDDLSRIVAPEQLGLSAGMEAEGMLVLEPLEMGTLPLGLAAFTWGAEIPAHYEELREVLSAGLRALQLTRA